MDKCLIIDGLNFIYLSNNKTFQQEEGATGDYRLVFLFIRKLRALVEQFNPDKIFFLKESRSNFRKELSSDYKANRLVKHGMAQFSGQAIDYHQVNLIYDLLQYLPISVVWSEGYEADDCVLSLCDNLRYEHLTLVSNDNDWIMCLQQGYPHIQLYNPYKKRFVEAPKHLHLIYKCLRGDPSDNIAGLVGHKKATELASNPSKLATFLSLEENRANFSANRQLIELQLIPAEQLVVEDHIANFEYLKIRFREMEFNSIVRTEYWTKFKNTFSRLHL